MIFSTQVEYVAYNSMVQGDDIALDIQTPPEEFRPQKYTIQTPNLRRYSPGCLG